MLAISLLCLPTLLAYVSSVSVMGLCIGQTLVT